MIYLDNAATSWPKPEEVYKAMDEFMRNVGANPGRGGHKQSMEAGKIILRTREKLMDFFNGYDSRQIIFTLNATDSINLAIKGLLKEGDHVVTSSLEHNSVIRPLYGLLECGVELDIVSPDNQGIIDPNKIKEKIKNNTRLVVITHASNVIGSIQPVKEIGGIIKEHSYAKFMVDAAQTAGIIPIDIKENNIDFLALPGHKGLMGPQGTGVLYVSEDNDLKPWREGGTGSKSESQFHPGELPDKLESGTANTPGIAGLEKGIDYINEHCINEILAKKRNLLKKLQDGLNSIPEVEIYGTVDVNKKAPLVAFNIGEENSQEVSFALDQAFGIASRGGLHCAPLTHKHFENLDRGAVRLSIGAFNKEEHIDKTLHAVEEILEEL